MAVFNRKIAGPFEHEHPLLRLAQGKGVGSPKGWWWRRWRSLLAFLRFRGVDTAHFLF